MCSWNGSRQWEDDMFIERELEKWREERRQKEMDSYGPEWWESFRQAKIIYKRIEVAYMFGRA